MKMEELKKKMEAHLAAELAADTVKQVPPVTVQAPDMEEIKQSMASGSSASLLQAATGRFTVILVQLLVGLLLYWYSYW